MSKHLERAVDRLAWLAVDRQKVVHTLTADLDEERADRDDAFAAVAEAAGIDPNTEPTLHALLDLVRERAGTYSAHAEALLDIRDALGIAPDADALAEIARLKSAATPVLGTNEQAQAIRQATLREVVALLSDYLPADGKGSFEDRYPELCRQLRTVGWDGAFPDESTRVGVDLATGATVLCHEDAEGRVRSDILVEIARLKSAATPVAGEHAPDCRDTLCGGCREVLA